jgi:hypothetical protein
MPLLPHTLSWRGPEQLCLSFTTDILLSKKIPEFCLIIQEALGDPGVDKRIISRWIFRKCDVGV